MTKNDNGQNVGSRVYLMASDTKYRMFNLLNKEFTLDVDVSKLPCGLNGAVYFSEMDEDGGMSRFPGNKAGAKYGTGYCDSQCPTDIKFINGEVRCIFARLQRLFCNTNLSSDSVYRPMSRDGEVPLAIRARATTARAAPRWTSGKPTSTRPPTLRTRAR